MELLFVTVIAAGGGALMRSLLPKRTTYGMLLLPALGASIAAIVWVGLVFLGWKFDGTWIWLVTLGVSSIIVLVVGLVLPRRRIEADARLLDRLSRA
jgi:hypothetical protein